MPMQVDLGPSPLSLLKGVGEQITKKLRRLNILSIQDLLLHVPARYQDRTKIKWLRDIIQDDETTIEGVITHVVHPMKGRTKLMCELNDGSGRVRLRFFTILNFQRNRLKEGVRIRCYGPIRVAMGGLEMVHPEFQVVEEGRTLSQPAHLTAIYPTTEGVNQYIFRKLVPQAFNWMQTQGKFRVDEFAACFPFLPTFKEALQFLHFAPANTNVDALSNQQTKAQQRLILEELVAYQVKLLTLRQQFKAANGFALLNQGDLIKKFIGQLPFKLTLAQKRVSEAIQQDLNQPHPMLRLVQGDVGSGKTVVAALAMLQAVENQVQSVMMAPTELLAEQHHRVFRQWLTPFNIKLVYLSGNVKGKERKAILESIARGETQIIIGTHAVFQSGVKFADVGLLVIDEQHRFGVHQRALLREKGMEKGKVPHQLIMTATPIPRTLAMSAYADLDCSVIDELPPGRTPIATSVMSNARRDQVIDRINEACASGRQAYWVCPLINESDVLMCESAIETHSVLQQRLIKLKVGLIHGRMGAKEKEKVMLDFKSGDIDLLVATTVIEVGVDIPKASLMVIENAERMGLAQLHQLRGRVGRGSIESHCILLYQMPLSPIAKERLNVMRETTDGFKIAQRDLELRGAGDMLGVRQTGELIFKFADLVRDQSLLTEVQRMATEIIQNYPALAQNLSETWFGKCISYSKV